MTKSPKSKGVPKSRVTWKIGKLEMVQMEVKLEVKVGVEMEAPILQPIYTGAQAPLYT